MSKSCVPLQPRRLSETRVLSSGARLSREHIALAVPCFHVQVLHSSSASSLIVPTHGAIAKSITLEGIIAINEVFYMSKRNTCAAVRVTPRMPSPLSFAGVPTSRMHATSANKSPAQSSTASPLSDCRNPCIGPVCLVLGSAPPGCVLHQSAENLHRLASVAPVHPGLEQLRCSRCIPRNPVRSVPQQASQFKHSVAVMALLDRALVQLRRTSRVRPHSPCALY
ncbi:unnamed protein product [Chondrus crispus]|uniref:Uncharacterized protein n=1 Tax=Chondrus crispus TaxID=2769 RepID=R7QGW3_CHOCR|nr:unnamed protein product [Chondrus crispus]CDF36660.1 unnamed protein product [Chondrus crispus]|eukprot:XP_005716479.1 unnamed protein product [Chondrus crispus]